MLGILVLQAVSAGVGTWAALRQLRSEVRPDFRESQLLQTRRAALGIGLVLVRRLVLLLVRLRAGCPVSARSNPLCTRMPTRHMLPLPLHRIVALSSRGTLGGCQTGVQARERLTARGVGAGLKVG